MKNLRPETLGILQCIETLSGRPVEFKPDASLALRATLQMARHGAPSHVLRYRATNDPLDYWVAYQAGYALRLFGLAADARFDFAGTGEASRGVEVLVKAAQPLTAQDKALLPRYAELTAHWALMNLRSYAIGMRIDQWLATAHPALQPLQAAGIDVVQQENLLVLSKRLGNLSVPIPLLAPLAAGKESYAIPYRATGVVAHGRELLAIFDNAPSGPEHDCDLVDAWARAIGMTGWYRWTPYEP
jgi:hypothetical protein